MSYLRQTSNPLIRPHRFSLNQLSHLWTKDTTSFVKDLDLTELPFRSKMDSSIRRLKMRDVLPNLSSSTLAVGGWLAHMDQIWASNTLIWTELHGADAFLELKNLGLFNSLAHFVQTASELSSYIKRFPISESEAKQRYSEINSLSGFFTTDIVETDWEEELSALANGGQRHGLIGSDWKRDFALSNTQIKLPSAHMTRPEYITLYDYIESGAWLTSGSSSIGKISWEAGEKSGHFKARKNMLEYVYTTDELYKLIMEWDGTSRNRAFIKDEISKRRLAVSSNIEGYLLESYFLRLYGHPYKEWKFVTLDETSGTAHNRTAEVSALLANGAYALPFDFKGFDHQPTQWEISEMVESNLAEIRVPPQGKDEWHYIRHKIAYSYRHSEISMTLKDRHYQKDVTGGLPSGVRMTSLIGNQWNAIVTNIVVKYAWELTGSYPQAAGTRGDDTYIVHYSPVYLAIVRECYKAINAIGVDSKFGITQGVCEFLRNEISSTGQRGWSNRSIPSITQRKPWNPSPWGVSAQVTTTKDNIATLERRLGAEARFLHHSNKVKWSKYFRQSYKWLELPIREGGLGVYPDKGWRPDSKLSLANVKSVYFPNLIPTTPRWVSLDDKNATQFSQYKMTRLLATDDIVDVSKYTNAGILEQVRKMKVQWKQTKIESRFLTGVTTPQPRSPVRWPKDIYLEQEKWEGFTFMEVMEDAQIVAQILGTTLREIIENKFPATWARVKVLEQQGWHRTDAINITMGRWPDTSLFAISPQVNRFITSAIGKKMAYTRGRVNIARTLYAYTWSGERQMIENGILRTYGF